MASARGRATRAPFDSVAFYVPPQPGHSGQLVADVVSRSADDVVVYGWTPADFVYGGLLRFCLTEDDASQVSFVEQVVRAQLARHAYPLVGEPGAMVLCEDAAHGVADLRADRRAPTAEERTTGQGVAVRDFEDLLDYLIARLEDGDEHNDWTGRAATGTVMAFLRRVMALGLALRSPDAHAACGACAWTSISTVVDIHQLHASAQRFVVGALVWEVFESKQGTGREPLRFVMLDELNKYAPREGRGPLKDLFIDIAERGRSLGVLLIGCQQAAGRVAEPVVRQPALKVCGRLDASEAADYRFLTPELRERATRFLPGTMVLDQPIVPAPIPVRFPFPPYATNTADAVVPERERSRSRGGDRRAVDGHAAAHLRLARRQGAGQRGPAAPTIAPRWRRSSQPPASTART